MSSFAVAAEVGQKRVANEGEPRRALPVQRAELAVGVPPFAGERLEALDLAGIERGPEPPAERGVLSMRGEDTGGAPPIVKARGRARDWTRGGRPINGVHIAGCEPIPL